MLRTRLISPVLCIIFVGIGMADYLFPSSNPPGGKQPNQVKQYIVLTWDDNAYSGKRYTQYEDEPNGNYQNSSWIGGEVKEGGGTRPKDNALNLKEGDMGVSWASVKLAGHIPVPYARWVADYAYNKDTLVYNDSLWYPTRPWPPVGAKPQTYPDTLDILWCGRRISGKYQRGQRSVALYCGRIPVSAFRYNPYDTLGTNTSINTADITGIEIQLVTSGINIETHSLSVKNLSLYGADGATVGTDSSFETVMQHGIILKSITKTALRLGFLQEGIYTIVLSNAQGKLIRTFNNIHCKAGLHELGLNSIAHGVYVITIKNMIRKASFKSLVM